MPKAETVDNWGMPAAMPAARGLYDICLGKGLRPLRPKKTGIQPAKPVSGIAS